MNWIVDPAQASRTELEAASRQEIIVCTTTLAESWQRLLRGFES
jgi:hypothetical protein